MGEEVARQPKFFVLFQFNRRVPFFWYDLIWFGLVCCCLFFWWRLLSFEFYFETTPDLWIFILFQKIFLAKQRAHFFLLLLFNVHWFSLFSGLLIKMFWIFFFFNPLTVRKSERKEFRFCYFFFTHSFGQIIFCFVVNGLKFRFGHTHTHSSVVFGEASRMNGFNHKRQWLLGKWA